MQVFKPKWNHLFVVADDSAGHPTAPMPKFSAERGFIGVTLDYMKKLYYSAGITADRPPTNERGYFNALLSHYFPDFTQADIDRIWKIRIEKMNKILKGAGAIEELSENLHLFNGILDPKDVDMVDQVCKDFKEAVKKRSSTARASRAGVLYIYI